MQAFGTMVSFCTNLAKVAARVFRPWVSDRITFLRPGFSLPQGFGLRQSSGAFTSSDTRKAAEGRRTPRRCRAGASTFQKRTGGTPVPLHLGRRSVGYVMPLVVVTILALSSSVFAEEPNPTVVQWLDAQKNIQTWSADFTQTRTLKSLAQPLKERGRVWFSAPNQFRWELGNPPKTIAIRQTNVLYVVYPRLKRAERYQLSGETGQWRETLSLLDAGFPRSQSELQSRYNIVSQSVAGETGEVTLQPKSASARRMMSQIKIAFSTNDFSLRATELQFADGSTLRNDFTNAVLNPKLEPSLFEPNFDSDYKITEPLKQR